MYCKKKETSPLNSLFKLKSDFVQFTLNQNNQGKVSVICDRLNKQKGG
ncbi:hypothetical protein SMSP2_00265 [Limihaloglobus sulfuriphilus]|uniref:Uncharacterized protein n=1 Tax=Limihaloglobus sulfuriphilus TaxID=1851148 RepID=A0A1Q2MB76_9BACT|nr:hypothetical protein SMSP2_00265 [Limihaloglobus sulfuriphilus]